MNSNITVINRHIQYMPGTIMEISNIIRYCVLPWIGILETIIPPLGTGLTTLLVLIDSVYSVTLQVYSFFVVIMIMSWYPLCMYTWRINMSTAAERAQLNTSLDILTQIQTTYMNTLWYITDGPNYRHEYVMFRKLPYHDNLLTFQIMPL